MMIRAKITTLILLKEISLIKWLILTTQIMSKIKLMICRSYLHSLNNISKLLISLEVIDLLIINSLQMSTQFTVLVIARIILCRNYNSSHGLDLMNSSQKEIIDYMILSSVMIQNRVDLVTAIFQLLSLQLLNILNDLNAFFLLKKLIVRVFTQQRYVFPEYGKKSFLMIKFLVLSILRLQPSIVLNLMSFGLFFQRKLGQRLMAVT